MKHVNCPLQPEAGFLIGRDEGTRLKEAICDALGALDENEALALDFSAVEFVDVSCADELVVKVLARLQAGEYLDRFLVLVGLKPQHRENVEAALSVGGKAVLSQDGSDWTVLGDLISSYRDALAVINERGEITARELFESMHYETINEASTKLSALYKLCLIGREPYRRPVRGGGRQFRYLSLLA